MAKPSRNRERGDRIEQMRRESQRAERRRTLVVVAICGVLALAIVGATGWKLYTDSQREAEVEDTALAAIGEPAEAAGCQDVVTQPADGSADHVDPRPVDYEDAPPAFGPHWQTPAEFERKFYADTGRPEIEQIVHNLEHGYTVLWYDETIADDSEALATVEDLATKFEVGTPDDIETYNENKFLAVPWTSDDGEAFPDDAHIALTRWVAEEGVNTPEGEDMGAWEYCDAPSGEAVAQFMAEYPAEESLEPGAA